MKKEFYQDDYVISISLIANNKDEINDIDIFFQEIYLLIKDIKDVNFSYCYSGSINNLGFQTCIYNNLSERYEDIKIQLTYIKFDILKNIKLNNENYQCLLNNRFSI